MKPNVHTKRFYVYKVLQRKKAKNARRFYIGSLFQSYTSSSLQPKQSVPQINQQSKRYKTFTIQI